MFPLYSVLKDSQFDAPNVNMVLLHLKRKHLMEWVRSVMATSLGVQPGDSLPPIWMQDEAGTSYSQLTQPLEGIPPDLWVCCRSQLPSRRDWQSLAALLQKAMQCDRTFLQQRGHHCRLAPAAAAVRK